MSGDLETMNYEAANARWIYENAEKIAKRSNPRLTQDDLSKAIGISRQSWTKRKNNGTMPSNDELNNLCNLLGCARNDIETPPYEYAKQFNIDLDISDDLQESILLMAFKHLDADERQNVLDLVMNLWKLHDRLE